jgi:hypothetical protein
MSDSDEEKLKQDQMSFQEYCDNVFNEERERLDVLDRDLVNTPQQPAGAANQVPDRNHHVQGRNQQRPVVTSGGTHGSMGQTPNFSSSSGNGGFHRSRVSSGDMERDVSNDYGAGFNAKGYSKASGHGPDGPHGRFPTKYPFGRPTGRGLGFMQKEIHLHHSISLEEVEIWLERYHRNYHDARQKIIAAGRAEHMDQDEIGRRLNEFNRSICETEDLNLELYSNQENPRKIFLHYCYSILRFERNHLR